MRGREDKRKGFAFQLMCQKCQGREEKKAPLVYWLHAWARRGREEYVMIVTVLHRHFRINTPQEIFSVVVRYRMGAADYVRLFAFCFSLSLYQWRTSYCHSSDSS